MNTLMVEIKEAIQNYKIMQAKYPEISDAYRDYRLRINELSWVLKLMQSQSTDAPSDSQTSPSQQGSSAKVSE